MFKKNLIGLVIATALCSSVAATSSYAADCDLNLAQKDVQSWECARRWIANQTHRDEFRLDFLATGQVMGNFTEGMFSGFFDCKPRKFLRGSRSFLAGLMNKATSMVLSGDAYRRWILDGFGFTMPANTTMTVPKLVEDDTKPFTEPFLYSCRRAD